MIRFLFLVFYFSLFGTDYDCIFIGSSPFSLMEALYQSSLNQKVLIIEKSKQLGGAWQGVEVFGLENVDLGCHQIGKSTKLKNFVEEFLGCETVSLDDLHSSYDEKSSCYGWYFRKGSHELIDRLCEKLLQNGVNIFTEVGAKNITLDAIQNIGYVETDIQTFSASKIFVTNATSIPEGDFSSKKTLREKTFYHLYLLIQDSYPYRFTYSMGKGGVALRMFNLTALTTLDPNQQLIVFQLKKEAELETAQELFENLKKDHFISEDARLIDSQVLNYKTSFFYTPALHNQNVVELIQTGHIQIMKNEIERYSEVIERL